MNREQRMPMKSLAALVFCVCFLVISYVNVSSMIAASKHICCGEVCPVCVHNESVQTLVDMMGMAEVKGFFFFVAFLFVRSLAFLSIFFGRKLTPIFLKVRMNN